MVQPLSFSVRDLISPPFVACPRCNRDAYGILSIHTNSYSRMCRDCLYPRGSDDQAWIALPKLKKKIIYLDQNAISEMMKAINPEVESRRRTRVDPRWRTLFEQLCAMSGMQLIVCPESPFHQEESCVWTHFEALRRMYEHLSCDVHFLDSHAIQWTQIRQHATLWAAGTLPLILDTPHHYALRENVDSWNPRVQIRARLGNPNDDRVELREFRTQAFERQQWFETWVRENGPIDFGARYKNELSDYGPIIVRDYPWNFFALRAVHRAEKIVAADAPGEWEGREQTFDYFRTADFSSVPYNRISSLLLANIAHQIVSGGRKRPFGRGTHNDINAISSYLPYCDAMFVDHEMWELLRDGHVCSRLPFNTRLFSFKKIDEFLGWLNVIESECTEEHRLVLREVYGESVGNPFVDLYT